MRESQDAIVGAVTGSLPAPRSLLLGRLDAHGRLRYTGHSTILSKAAVAAFAGLLSPATAGHPCTGWTCSAGSGTRQILNVTLVGPDVVVEVDVDVARDGAGRWRHPARRHRTRPDLSPGDIARFGI